MISILRQLYEFAPNVCLALAGGEPLMRRGLRGILSWIRSNNERADVELLTNATLINASNIGWLSELVTGFNVGLEGTREINDKIRGEGSFMKAIRGISLLTKKGKKVAVRMTYFHQGEKEVKNLMKILPDFGVEYFNFRYVVPVGRATDSQVCPQQYKNLAEIINQLGEELGLKIGFSDPFPHFLLSSSERRKLEKDKGLKKGKAVTGCSMGFNLLYLDPKGNVKTCPYFPIFCDSAKYKPLKEIWFNNPTLKRIRKIRSSLLGKCGDCEYKFACGGCRGAAMATGDFLNADPRCWK